MGRSASMMGIAFPWFSDDSSGKAVGEQAVARLPPPKLPLPSGERVWGEGVALLPDVPLCGTPSPALRATLSPEGRGLSRPTQAKAFDAPSQRGAPRLKVRSSIDDRPPWKACPA
ncbi:hypothetical protein C1S70_24890 (plasmid) [Azospirillum argentinense]|uniref:Uncharacterized protein n=1 Tax=Azospirillum argentinense TaxID=2970906 RepID=A0A2K1FUV7_9PROT|nr:hypothetical protein C1S70_24890 [Azospirillum argentinense]